MKSVEQHSKEGLRGDLLSAKIDGDDSIIYSARLTFADGVVIEPESRATFKGGRLHHVEPFDPKKYNKFFVDAQPAGASPIPSGQ